ncbi:DUF2933 domain-containing protein [Saccharospirillum impatiens]|jgi:hypothetical protein|uniref:DUF2933 domain-containing protein n=1 Tax=Saccharospirillum impatiens TaxID=169438 RepID=UPI000560E56B|nr:DUF2933 domain-containing protein [Saccharospirillum impatiens]
MDRRFKIILAIVAVAVLVLLWGEHKAQLLGALPWLIILACPLMHMFMHRGHGSHKHHVDQPGRGAQPRDD